MSNEDSTREVIRHYGDVDESCRLRTGWFQLEQARTRELILRHLPAAPAMIIDAGGGAGAYACWLAARGYQVQLIDPVLKHVEQARVASSQQSDHPLVSAEVGDARHLPQGDATADAVLLLGPLYHLVEREDRLACLREAHRVSAPEARCGARPSVISPPYSIRYRADSSMTLPSRQSSRVIWKKGSIGTAPTIRCTSPTLSFIGPKSLRTSL
jgi:ubiquinone/menaquinone biosynthesis C-methylase UbiE